MRSRFVTLALALAFGLTVPLQAASHAKKKAAKRAQSEAPSAEDILGADLAGAVEMGGQAYDQAAEAMNRDAKGRRSNKTSLIRRIGAVRADYEAALAKARGARTPDGDSLLRDQVVVSLSQSLRACDLITQGLRDGDDDEKEAGMKLAALAQADLDRLASGEATGGGGDGGDGGGSPDAIGPSLGLDLGMTSSNGTFNLNYNANVSAPFTRSMDAGVGLQMTLGSTDTSGNLNLGGNVFSRLHFLDMFPSSSGVVPYVGVKLGYTYGTNWSGTGINFSTSDSSTVELAGQLGSLFFINRKTALTLQLELGSSSSSTDNGTKVSSSSSSSTALTLGFRRMF